MVKIEMEGMVGRWACELKLDVIKGWPGNRIHHRRFTLEAFDGLSPWLRGAIDNEEDPEASLIYAFDAAVEEEGPSTEETNSSDPVAKEGDM